MNGASKEFLAKGAIEQAQRDIAARLVPYVKELLNTPVYTYDMEPSELSRGGGIRTLFLHETLNITPEINIFKLDLVVNLRRLRRTQVELTVLEREQSDKRYTRSVVKFTLLRDGSPQFDKLESDAEMDDPLRFLTDLKKGLDALSTVSYGTIPTGKVK